MRDSRRSVGIDNFELEIEHITGKFDFKNQREGIKFDDRVALGNYNTDIHGLSVCQYPESS
jgi:hypothetical protein